jgi:hypothetical protein
MNAPSALHALQTCCTMSVLTVAAGLSLEGLNNGVGSLKFDVPLQAEHREVMLPCSLTFPETGA